MIKLFGSTSRSPPRQIHGYRCASRIIGPPSSSVPQTACISSLRFSVARAALVNRACKRTRAAPSPRRCRASLRMRSLSSRDPSLAVASKASVRSTPVRSLIVILRALSSCPWRSAIYPTAASIFSSVGSPCPTIWCFADFVMAVVYAWRGAQARCQPTCGTGSGNQLCRR